MNIGILGSGDVGRRLGDGFIELGHNVKIGSRDPNKGDIARWVSSHVANEGRTSSGTFAEGSIICRACRYSLLLGLEHLMP